MGGAAGFALLVSSLALGQTNAGEDVETPAPKASEPTLTANAVCLTNAAQVLALSPHQASELRPVRIRGMVTYYDPTLGLFIQDETGGVFVYYAGGTIALHAHEYVEVEGVANQGRYSPIVDSPQVHPVADGPSVTPRPVSLAQIYLGGLDAQWVELEGVVRRLDWKGNTLGIELAVPPHRLMIWAPKPPHKRMHLTGSLVRVRGVVGTVCAAKGQLTAFQVFVDALSDIKILAERPEDPFSQPLTLLGDLQSQYTRRDPQVRVHTRGTVTLSWSGRVLFIQDATGGAQVRPNEAVGDLVPGSIVEVSGFPGPVLEPALIDDALIRRLGNGPTPQAPLISTDDLAHSRRNNELVEIEATLLESSYSASNGMVMALQSGDQFLSARWESAGPTQKMPGARPGSRLRLTGVCRVEAPALGSRSLVSLLLRSPKDLQVLAAPVVPLTGGAVFSITAAILAGGGLIFALWHIAKQQRQTEHMLKLQTVLQTEMRQGEQQLRRSMEEREQIGRDLHDDIIQSIYAVGLNLEDCRRVIRQSPEKADGRIGSAINALNGTIQSVRGFLSGLEPKVLNGREFRTALKSLALTSGEGPTQFQIDVDPSAANRLSSTQATQLLHIAKEAMSNSLRHARASSVNVSLQPVGLGVRLEIRDDGIGFAPENTEGRGHGLRNMTARARDIGAELQIISARDQGCRILTTVPQRNPNEHG